MNRRGFLTALVAGAAGLIAAELDPERLLWIPGAKTLIMPPAAGWYPRAFPPFEAVVRSGGNDLLTIDIITREALKILNGNLVFAKKVNRFYSEEQWV